MVVISVRFDNSYENRVVSKEVLRLELSDDTHAAHFLRESMPELMNGHRVVLKDSRWLAENICAIAGAGAKCEEIIEALKSIIGLHNLHGPEGGRIEIAACSIRAEQSYALKVDPFEMMDLLRSVDRR